MRRHNKTVLEEQAQAALEALNAPESPMAEVLAAIATPIPAVTIEATGMPVQVQAPMKVRRFRVMRERPYVENGMRCILREGAIVDSSSRDLELLRKQGVPLEELVE